MAPQEQNPSPTPKMEPSKGERKMSKKKQKKIDLEELKKELVMVRRPRMGADQMASENFLSPQPFNILPTGPSQPSSPQGFLPLPWKCPGVTTSPSITLLSSQNDHKLTLEQLSAKYSVDLTKVGEGTPLGRRPGQNPSPTVLPLTSTQTGFTGHTLGKG